MRLRAARIGFEVFVRRHQALLPQARPTSDSGIKLDFGVSGDERAREASTPRLSTANQVSEVRVRAWDPETEEGDRRQRQAAELQARRQDAAPTVDRAKTHKNVLTIDVDVPVFSKEEADDIAKSILQDRLMYVHHRRRRSAKGNPDLKPGIIVTVIADDKRFDGKYYITAVRHRYVHAGPDHGYPHRTSSSSATPVRGLVRRPASSTP